MGQVLTEKQFNAKMNGKPAGRRRPKKSQPTSMFDITPHLDPTFTGRRTRAGNPKDELHKQFRKKPKSLSKKKKFK